jgi:hypothetical protein
LDIASTLRVATAIYASSLVVSSLNINTISLSNGINIGNLTITSTSVFQGTTTVQGNLQISSFVLNQWIAVGQDAQSNATLKRSYDGLSWTNTTGLGFTTAGNNVAWNGTRWIAVGQGGCNILTSVDGTQWSSANASFSEAGYDIKWNGQLWVATGQDTNTLKYSTDGITWSNGSGGFSVTGTGLGWNGYQWIAVGQDATNAIKYSKDGITWSNSAQTFSVGGSAAAWNGQIWVAVGQDATNTIKYSKDGITWSNATAPFSISGYGIAWNGRMWIAVGQDASASIKYSYSGISWSNTTGSFTTLGKSVAWNGQVWIAVGQDTANAIKYSKDGITWSNSAETFSVNGRGISYSSNIYASLVTQDLDINGTGQQIFVTSTNQITSGFSSLMILNNTVYIDKTNNRVGINTSLPQADLDINGTLAKTAGSFDIVHPDPEKAERGYRLRHCFVESPTRGDNIYRWLLSTVNKSYVLDLPSYYQWLNEDSHCYVSPVDTFGRGRAIINTEGTQLALTTSEDGLWNVLCIATRKDIDAKNYFDEKGVEYC